MQINRRDVAVLLTEDGRQVLRLAQLSLPDSASITLEIEDTDDMGLWARVHRGDGDHLILIRWDYVLAVDFPAGEPRALGLKP
ncbi:MAG TPA: hypothetical protein VFU50_07335 [Terriglobales bacterium]|nr:hypothetical protein [Terriglobales bacterium]